MKKRIKWVFSVHHWLGLLLGLFLLIASVTGAVLVFHHEIDHAQFAHLSRLKSPARELIIDNSLARIRQLHPAADIRVPDITTGSQEALKYEVRQEGERKWIFVHPETGEILATLQRADQRLVHVLLELHYMLLAGTTGKIMVLVGGIALFVLSISGIFLYRKSIAKVLLFKQRISFKSRRSLFSSLHRVIGVWSLLFNLLLCVTGSWIAFTIVQSAFTASSSAPLVQPTAANRSVDGVLKQLQKDYPLFEMKYLLPPKQSGGKMTVLGRLQTDPAYYGETLSHIQVDMGSGEILQALFVSELPWHQRAIKVLKPLHFGTYAGMGVKLLYAFFGIFPALLSISGFLIWWFRPQKKIPVQKKAISRPAPATAVV